MSKVESKEVAVKSSNEVATEFKGMFNAGLGLGAGENIDNEDILIPKIQLVQALSQAVTDKQAQAGDYFNTVDKVVIESPLDIVVMSSVKLWQVFKEVPTGKGTKVKLEYVETIDFLGNEDLEIDQDMGNGQVIHRDKLLRFYVVLVNDLKDGMAFPHVIDFKRTSYKAGRELQTKFARLRSVGLPSYSKIFALDKQFIQSEFDYYVKTVSTGRNITSEELVQVEQWIIELQKNKQKYKADESEETEGASNTVESEVVNKSTATKAKF
jgi:hypothetical protein